jgi:G:T-mismatch repair DNA endonuclease (very short patch repair protein)
MSDEEVAPISEVASAFADGDFWHGRGLASRLRRLAKGHNAKSWISKSNVRRDRRVKKQVEVLGWRVLRDWESEIMQRLIE